MSPPVGLFGPKVTVREATDALREQVKSAFITYLYVVDVDRRLLGLVVMREMLLAEPDTPLEAIMIADPFALEAHLPLAEALKRALHRHFPVYPVVEPDGRLVGLVRGSDLFANRAI
jgi:magnesium transporter